MAYLSDNGLETGGTGSKVRPVVSCKGTTCQYGLIDTYDLSQKLHERFYEGYHSVNLPHKFKIAVGGCPNNCVKPNLNDLGIVGQCVPEVDPAKCRGCKLCQVEKSCPIHDTQQFLIGVFQPQLVFLLLFHIDQCEIKLTGAGLQNGVEPQIGPAVITVRLPETDSFGKKSACNAALIEHQAQPSCVVRMNQLRRIPP